jgi:hypothetical protein
MIWPGDDIDDLYEHQRDRMLQEQAERERYRCRACGSLWTLAQTKPDHEGSRYRLCGDGFCQGVTDRI